VLKLFLLSLETALNTVMPISEVIEWIKRLSSNYQSNPLNVKVSKRTARRILREISLFERSQEQLMLDENELSMKSMICSFYANDEIMHVESEL
jgi:hypothetical protein